MAHIESHSAPAWSGWKHDADYGFMRKNSEPAMHHDFIISTDQMISNKA